MAPRYERLCPSAAFTDSLSARYALSTGTAHPGYVQGSPPEVACGVRGELGEKPPQETYCPAQGLQRPRLPRHVAGVPQKIMNFRCESERTPVSHAAYARNTPARLARTSN